MYIPVRSQHLWQQRCFFRASIEVWQNVFLEFIDTQLQTAARLAHLMCMYVLCRLGSKQFSFPVWVLESASLQSTLYIRPPWLQFNQYNFMISVPHMRIYNTLIPKAWYITGARHYFAPCVFLVLLHSTVSVTCSIHTLTEIRPSNENDGLCGACQHQETTLSSLHTHRHLASWKEWWAQQ